MLLLASQATEISNIAMVRKLNRRARDFKVNAKVARAKYSDAMSVAD